MPVWVRVTEPAQLLEVREDYMRGAEEAPRLWLGDTLAVILSEIMPVRVRLEATGRHGGVFAEFCFEGLITGENIGRPFYAPEPGVASLGRALEWHIRRRVRTTLRWDGVVRSASIPLRTVVAVLHTRRLGGVRATLYLARNWLVGGSENEHNRFGRDNAIYVEAEPRVLRQIAGRVISGRPRRYTPTVTPVSTIAIGLRRRIRGKLEWRWEKHREARSMVDARVDPDWFWATVEGHFWAADAYPDYLVPAGSRLVLYAGHREAGDIRLEYTRGADEAFEECP